MSWEVQWYLYQQKQHSRYEWAIVNKKGWNQTILQWVQGTIQDYWTISRSGEVEYKRHYAERRLQKNVAEMHALIIEIDDVGLKELVHTLVYSLPRQLRSGIMTQHPYQRISFVVGMACTCIMCLKQPVKLYKNVFEDLSRVRKRWIDRTWNANVVVKRYSGPV